MKKNEPIKEFRVEPSEFQLFTNVNIDVQLMDVRIMTHGLNFGTPRQICSQFGIKIVKVNGGHLFIAPKSRLQYLLEKLHFAQMPYSIR